MSIDHIVYIDRNEGNRERTSTASVLAYTSKTNRFFFEAKVLSRKSSNLVYTFQLGIPFNLPFIINSYLHAV